MTMTALDDHLARVPRLVAALRDGRWVYDGGRWVLYGGVASSTLDEAGDTLEALAAWKAEALVVFDEWEQVWEAAGRPGPLGYSKADNVRAHIEALAAERRLTDAAQAVVRAAVDLHQNDPGDLGYAIEAYLAAGDAGRDCTP